ncbi:DNA cytosine methyltransferase [Pyruvatibacter mobilis]|uniref:DNA cytosine methyltransferase n=1 Tax=Pyruvatibacter mobilis TaxID=1712261 RepID=UPI003BAFD291
MVEIAAVDLFCGAGGLTHGLEQEGINVVAGYDIDPECEYAYDTNNGSNFHEIDVAELSAGDIEKHLRTADLSLLAGCAPCQAFSRINQNSKSKFKPHKWSLVDKFVDLVVDTQPDFITMENVPSLLNQRRFESAVQKLIDNEYQVCVQIVDCSDYGAPQKRKRLVLLGSRRGPIEIISTDEFGEKPQTVEDAIGHLPPLAAGEQSRIDPLHRASGLAEINLRRIRHSKPGGSWKDWPDALQLKCHTQQSGSTYVSVYGRMDWAKASPTITTFAYNYGSGRFGHPKQDRALSLREAALLQTFPPSYQFFDSGKPYSIRKVAKLIGNAVPVILGRVVARSIQKAAARLDVE